MSELERWAYAICVGVAAGCGWALWTYARDYLIHLLSLLVAHWRKAER